jgi:phosphomannomutase/phosphoglucomutase
MLFETNTNILARDYPKQNRKSDHSPMSIASKNLYVDIFNERNPNHLKNGHANFKMRIRNSVEFAGEMSGHVFMADRYLGFDDATT